MEHLHNFLKEIQNLPMTSEKYYGLAPGEHSKHLHRSELKEGQEYDHECEKKSIPEHYTSSEYKKQLYDLANAALTELLLLSKQQQLNVIGRLRNIKNRIKDIDYGVSAYTENNEKDNFEEHEIHRLLTYSFPIINIPYGAPDRWFRGRLREIIRIKINSIDFVKNSLGATLRMVDSFIEYGQYKPSKINDPYFIIECATSGLLRINYQFNEQIKERKTFRTNGENTTAELVFFRSLHHFHIAQELPFIDFVLFRSAVRKLLLNVPNKVELKTILEVCYNTAEKNVEMYVNTIEYLEKLSGNRNVRDIPDELKGMEVEQETKYLTFSMEFTSTYHNQKFKERDAHVHSKFYINRDLAVHSEKVLLFLNAEIYEGKRKIETKISAIAVSITATKIDKLTQVIGGYFHNAELLFQALSGSNVDVKLVYRKSAKQLCAIFKYLHSNGIINNDVATLQMWLIRNFEYTSKGNPKQLASSTVTRYFESNDPTPPIPQLEELV